MLQNRISNILTVSFLGHIMSGLLQSLNHFHDLIAKMADSLNVRRCSVSYKKNWNKKVLKMVHIGTSFCNQVQYKSIFGSITYLNFYDEANHFLSFVVPLMFSI